MYHILLLLLIQLATAQATYGQSASLAFYNGAPCAFNTAGDVASGCTTNNYIIVQYNINTINYPAGWTLKVQANGDFSNGSSTIPVQYISLNFNSSNGGPSGVNGTGYQSLSTSNPASLINTSDALLSPPTYYFEHRLDMRIQGGNHLMAGTGTFSTTLTLTIVAQNGTIIATKNDVTASFTVNYSNSCSGAAIGSYFSNQVTFSTYAQQMAGATATDAITLQYNPNNASCVGWSMRVRAAGNFTNGGNSIAPQYFSLRFNRVSVGSPSASAIGVGNNEVPLNTNDATLINQSNAGFTAYSATEHKLDLIIKGGNHLLLANGTYTGSLIFTLYNQAGQAVSNTTVSVAFAINSVSNSSYTMVLQNGAENVDMFFTSTANYASGVSVTKPNGLRITGYSAYQVIVKASSDVLTSAYSSATIPVDVAKIEATKSTTTSAGIITYTRNLSASDQVLITNPLSDYTQQVVEYTIRYYTLPNDSRFPSASGDYTVNIIFAVIPQ